MRRVFRLLSSCLFACATSLAAQSTKIDLGTQVKGQLPAANAGAILGAATTAALNAVYGTGPSNAAGTKRGARAMHGFTERFTASMHCAAGTSSAEGFDSTTGLACNLPGFFHGGGNFDVERNLAFGITNAQPPAPTHFGLSFSAVYGGGSNAYGGMSTCTVGTYNCGAASEIGVSVTSAGFSLQVAGTTVVQWAAGGNGSGSTGTTDSGTGSGWNGPTSGNIYGVTLLVPGDGTAIMSVMPMSGALNLGSSGFSARVPITLPSGSLHQFFIRGGSGDYISDVAYADGYVLAGGAGGVVYDIPSHTHIGTLLRWALHSTGAEWDYRTSASDISNAWALLPPNYNPDAANPLIFQFRGQESSIVSFFGTFLNTAEGLYEDGFVQVFADFHARTYYGSPADMTDLAGALSVAQAGLSLAARPYFEADSAGGIVALNAISQGVVSPLALICYSCNTSLYWDAYTASQMSLVENDFGFTIPAQYSTYTSPSGQVSYDPMVAIGTPGTGQTLLVGVPMLLIADSEGGDTTVDTTANSTALVNAANAVRPGIATISYVGGGHVSGNKFNGLQAVQFFNQH